MNRIDLLRPKTEFLLQHLKNNDPGILHAYGISTLIAEEKRNSVFFIMPYYDSILNYSSLIKNTINEVIMECENTEIKENAKDIKITIAFKKSSTVGKLIQ